MRDINIFLIRHAESHGNLDKDKIGQDAKTPLTERGIDQAGRLGRRFLVSRIQFDDIWSSTYLRAETTADIFAKAIAYKDKIKYTDAIVEYNPGDWKGQSRTELYSDMDTLKKIVYQHMGFVFPNGESYHKVARRATAFIEDHIIHNEDVLKITKHKPYNVAVFSHGMTIKCMLNYIMGFDQSFLWRVRVDNTAIQHAVFNDKGWFINSINDCGHLLA